MKQTTEKSTMSCTLKSMTCSSMDIVCLCDTHVDTRHQVRNTICLAALILRQEPAILAFILLHFPIPSRYSRPSKTNTPHCFETIYSTQISLPIDRIGKQKRLSAVPPSQVNFFKKFLLQKHRFITGSFRKNANKFGKYGAIFHKNTAVSCAATSSTEYQMLHQNRTVISRFVPTSVCANTAHRSTVSAFHFHTAVGVR